MRKININIFFFANQTHTLHELHKSNFRTYEEQMLTQRKLESPQGSKIQA